LDKTYYLPEKLNYITSQRSTTMISPERLRHHQFFSRFKEAQLISLSMITEQIALENEETLFEEGQPAKALYFLLSGCVDLFYTVVDSARPEDRKEALVCQVNPGEMFGISALIEPYTLTATARSVSQSVVLRLDLKQLQGLFEKDPQLEILMMHKVAKAAIERLHCTRVLLAAAYA
jgi:CRP-like cAMP-binding protein